MFMMIILALDTCNILPNERNLNIVAGSLVRQFGLNNITVLFTQMTMQKNFWNEFFPWDAHLIAF